MADIFISYSRRDSTFADQLRNALIAQGRSVWVDTADIMPTSEWRQDIIDAIEAASAVLFVLSQRELQYAVEMQKKLIPVVCRDVDHRLVNPTLANLNWIFARPTDDLNRSLQQILFAIDTDLVYWREGSDLLVRARQWAQGNRRPAFTLRGEPLRQAEQWLTASATKHPGPSALQIEYITAGRRASAARQRVTISALSIGIVVTLVLAIVAGIFANITAQQNVRLAGSAIGSLARAAGSTNSFDQGLLLANAAYPLNSDDLTTRDTLFSLVNASPHFEAQLQSNTIPLNTTDVALSAGFSADGKTLVTISKLNVTVWDVATHKQRSSFYSDGAFSAAVSPDGTLVAFKVKVDPKINHNILLWNTTTGKLIRQFDGQTYEDSTSNNGDAHAMVFSPDGTLLASIICPTTDCTTSSIVVWNVATGNIITQIPGKYALHYTQAQLAFSADGKWLAYSENNFADLTASHSYFAVWDLAHKKPVFNHDATTVGEIVKSLTFTPDNHILAVGGVLGYNGQVTLWDLDKQQPLPEPFVEPAGGIDQIAFSPDALWMLTATNEHTIRLWDIETGTPFGDPLPDLVGATTVIAFSPDGQHFMSGLEDGQISLWHVTPFSDLSPDPSQIFSNLSQIAYSPDGKYLAIANNFTDHILLWDIARHQLAHEFVGVAGVVPISLGFSPDGTRLAVGGFYSNAYVINVTSGQVEGTTWNEQPGIDPSAKTPITTIAFSPDGHSILTVDAVNFNVALWDAQTHALVKSFDEYTASSPIVPVFATFSADGKQIAVSQSIIQAKGPQDEVAIYNLQQGNGTKIWQHKHPLQVLAWLPQSTILAGYDDNGDIYSWDSASGKETFQFHQPDSGNYSQTLQFRVQSSQERADQRAELMFGSSERLEIWQLDLQNSANSRRFVSPITTQSNFQNAQFSPDGNELAISEGDSGVEIRSLNYHDWEKQACAMANRNLTKAEWEQYIKPYSSKPFSDFAKMCSAFPAGT